MTKLATMGKKLSGVLAQEFAPESGYCRKTATVTVETGMDVGAVVVRSLTTPTATAVITGTGNGSIGTITVADTAATGIYTLKIVKVSAVNTGDFTVSDPQGDVIGNGAIGVAFSAGGLSFTLADGATDFVVGDSIAITVTGTIKYKWVEAADIATLNSDVAVMIEAGYGKDVPNLAVGDHQLTLLFRGPAAVVDAGLVYRDALTAAQKTTVQAALEAKGIATRTAV